MESQDGQFVELAMRALADTYAEKMGGELASEEHLRDMLLKATKGLKGRLDVNPEQLQTILDGALARPTYASGFEYSRRQVARWYEVPPDEFDQTDISNLHADVLFRHIYYESIVSTWFKDWGYSVQIGEELEGIEGADFIPDVYCELQTLHGNFAVAATLFCSNPPNTWRVLGMLENIEAFAPKGSEFGQRDIFLLVTPFKFLEQASNHIRIQAHQEDYYVVAVEGNDLQDLEHGQDPLSRMERLQDLVRAAARAKDVPAF